MQSFSTTQARTQLGEIINKVKYQKVIVALGRNNKAEVLVTPIPDEQDIPISEINTYSPSFDFLNNEEDIYSKDDLKVSYV
jgi:hypothetical protein